MCEYRHRKRGHVDKFYETLTGQKIKWTQFFISGKILTKLSIKDDQRAMHQINIEVCYHVFQWNLDRTCVCVTVGKGIYQFLGHENIQELLNKIEKRCITRVPTKMIGYLAPEERVSLSFWFGSDFSIFPNNFFWQLKLVMSSS